MRNQDLRYGGLGVQTCFYLGGIVFDSVLGGGYHRVWDEKRAIGG